MKFSARALSYASPHYVWQTNEIMVRVNNENSRADLQTIEDLIERRKRIRDESGFAYSSTSWSTKLITIESPVFETVVIQPHFTKENIVPFSKETDAKLFELANKVIRLSEQTPYQNHLILESRNSQGQITRCCRVDGNGRIVFQKTADIDENTLLAVKSFQFLVEVIEATRQIYAFLSFYGDVSVGLTVTNSMKTNLKLGFLTYRYPRNNYNCDWEIIHVRRALRYDDLENLSETIQSMFSEFCRVFHFAIDKDLTAKIFKENFLTLLN